MHAFLNKGDRVLSVAVMTVAMLALANITLAQQQTSNTRITDYNRMQQQQPTESYVRNKFQLFDHLIKKYERGVDTTDVGWEAESPELIKNATLSRQLADKLLKKGDLAGAQEQIDEALSNITRVLRSRRSSKREQELAKKNYDAAHRRIDGFYNALTSISEEKNTKIHDYIDLEQFEQYRAEADRLAASSDLKNAQSYLQKAAIMVERALARIRAKETLVHSLEFASIEEEYRYEAERNRSHEMLVKLMMAQNEPSADAIKIYNDMLAENNRIRAKADNLMQGKDVAGAKQLMEEGTDKLIRALRMGGMFIP
jgi:tetratricopeptide (TPR) repeat protein